jgi:hypothetical protein
VVRIVEQRVRLLGLNQYGPGQVAEQAQMLVVGAPEGNPGGETDGSWVGSTGTATASSYCIAASEGVVPGDGAVSDQLAAPGCTAR